MYNYSSKGDIVVTCELTLFIKNMLKSIFRKTFKDFKTMKLWNGLAISFLQNLMA